MCGHAGDVHIALLNPEGVVALAEGGEPAGECFDGFKTDIGEVGDEEPFEPIAGEIVDVEIEEVVERESNEDTHIEPAVGIEGVGDDDRINPLTSTNGECEVVDVSPWDLRIDSFVDDRVLTKTKVDEGRIEPIP